MTPRRRRRLRWVVPAAALAATAAISTIPKMIPASADPVPVLPPLTAAQLMDRVRTTNVTALSGDISFTARLGLPDLSSLGVGGGTFLDLLSGTHTAHVWVDGPERLRLAIDSPQAEQDWIRNGADVWSWDSTSLGVTHVALPSEGADQHERTPATVPAVDPATAAQQLLDAVDPTTEVSVRTPGYVAGRPVYELVVAPRSATSTVADGEIAVDAATGVPLAVRVHAKDTSAPVIDIEFTSISFDTPSASTFTFTPPPGSTVKEASSATELLPLGSFGRHGDRAARRAAKAAASGSDQAVTVAATGMPPRSDSTGPRSDAKVVGEAWDSVAIVSGVNLGRQFQTLFGNSPAVTVGSTTGHLVSTRLVNVLVLDDGRIAIGAVTPEALEAAVASA